LSEGKWIILAKEGLAQILLSITSVAPAPLLQTKSGGTNFIANREQIKVHKGLYKAGARSRFFTFYKAV